jgi:hypothetical protein
MTDRTIKIIGEAYSTSGDATCTISVDGVELYSGPVETNNSEPPTFQGKVDTVLAEFTVDVDFYGPKQIQITCNSGVIFAGDFVANYVFPFQIWDGPPIKRILPQRWVPLRDDPKFSNEIHFGSLPLNATAVPPTVPPEIDLVALQEGYQTHGHENWDWHLHHGVTHTYDTELKEVVKNGETVERAIPEHISMDTIVTEINWPYGRKPTWLTRLDPSEVLDITLNVPPPWKDSQRLTQAEVIANGGTYSDFY